MTPVRKAFFGGFFGLALNAAAQDACVNCGYDAVCGYATIKMGFEIQKIGLNDSSFCEALNRDVELQKAWYDAANSKFKYLPPLLGAGGTVLLVLGLLNDFVSSAECGIIIYGGCEDNPDFSSALLYTGGFLMVGAGITLAISRDIKNQRAVKLSRVRLSRNP